MVESNAGPAVEPDPELVDRLRVVVARLARRLRQESDVDLTPSQFAALSSIARCGPITLGDLAATERVRPPTMTRVVAALEEAGLVERATDPADRRVSRVRTTGAGDALLDHSRTHRDAFLARQLSALPPASLAELEHLVTILEQLSDLGRASAGAQRSDQSDDEQHTPAGHADTHGSVAAGTRR